MPLAKKNLSSLGWSKKHGFVAKREHFAKYTGMTSLSDAVKTFENMDALELWKDDDGNYYWATCATLTDKEMDEKKRVVLTFNQVMLIPDVKAEFNAWKKKKTDEPPKKLCGFRTPKCVLDSLDKEKKPRAPATPKKSKEEKDGEDAKEVSKGKSKKPAVDNNPDAVLSKHSAAALAGMDIDEANLDLGKTLEFEPFAAPSCTELDPTKEYTAHLQILHLMSMFEDQDNQNEKLIERIDTWVNNYRQSEAGSTKLTLVKWAKSTDPDFKNLLAGFGMTVLAAYKNKVVNPFVNSANEKLKEIVGLYQELQAKIKTNQVFVNQLKADKERLADDLQSMLAKNRALETELAEKKAEVTSLFQQLEERKKKEEKDDKKKRDEETAAVVNDASQTVISSSGGFRKRDDASPKKKSSSSSAALADSDVEEMEVDSGKISKKSSSAAAALADSDDELPAKPTPKKAAPVKAKPAADSDDEDDLFAKPASKKRTFGDSDDEEEQSKPTPKKTAVPAKPKANDEDAAFGKSSITLTAKSATAVSKVAKGMTFDSDDEDELSKPVAKATGKPKPNASKFLLDDEDD